MLDTRKTRVYNENKVVTILGPGTRVVGELSCQGTIRIEGAVQGTVFSDDSVVLLETGSVKGDVRAGQVIISGEVRGNVNAVDRLEITAHGKVLGDINAPRICIHEGVVFEGMCTMKADRARPTDSVSSGSQRPAAASTS
ncbi:MAG: polymer-forming cytoskeletal protein [Candidatus Hydrogenedentes bacterium]|nr:polymer-forming cytoskeletal protein [Candidatus Hydrogenedentota bacterium]